MSADRKRRKGTYMISAVAELYEIHPQTLRMYEREGLLQPSRSNGNTRLYDDNDLRRLEVILSLTRDLGVNLAGVEVILNMRANMERLQHEVADLDLIAEEVSGLVVPDALPGGLPVTLQVVVAVLVGFFLEQPAIRHAEPPLMVRDVGPERELPDRRGGDRRRRGSAVRGMHPTIRAC